MNTPFCSTVRFGMQRAALALTWVSVFAAARDVRAVVLSSNLDQRPDGVEAITRTRWVGSRFFTDEKNYLLTDVAVRLQRTLAGTVEAALYSDNNGKPGALVAVLKGPGSISSVPSNVVFSAEGNSGSFSRTVDARTSGNLVLPKGLNPKDLPSGEFSVSGERPSGIGLAPNTAYWVVTRAQSGEFAAIYTDSETGTGSGFTPEWARSTDAGQQWSTQGTSPLLFAANGALDFAVLELRTDEEAIASAIFSGLPTALVQTELAIAAANAATRDVNSRLFRHRAGEKVEKGVEVFAAGQFAAADIDAAGRATGAEGDTYTQTLGVEWRPSSQFALGVAVTHLESDSSLAFGLGNVEISGDAISAYASFGVGGFYADALYSYMEFEHDIRRETLFGDIASAQPDSQAHKLELNVGYNHEIGGFVLGVFGGFDYVNGDLSGYTERGRSTANVRIPTQDFESMVTRFGLSASRTFAVRRMVVTPQLRFAVAHEFMNEAQFVRASLVQSPYEIGDGRKFQRFGSFSAGANTHPRNDDWMELGAAVGLRVTDRFKVLCDYEARLFQGDGQVHSVGITGSWSF